MLIPFGLNKFIILCLMCTKHLVTPNVVTKSPQSHQTNSSLLRSKRDSSSCQNPEDGTYQIDRTGMTCCKCAAGQRLVKDCSVTPSDRKCEFCDGGKSYNSVPNSLDSCEPCRSCDPKANLEVEEQCTILRDAVCRCQKNHYCDKVGGDCGLCHPCQTCEEEGIKTACTATNNAICQDKQKEPNLAAIIVPIILVIIGCLLVLAYFCWRKRQKNKGQSPSSGPETGRPEERIPLKGVDIMPHVPDIAKNLGWTIMKEVALRCNMTQAAIENHQLDHLNNAAEQCLSLLQAWVQREGSHSGDKLVQTLLNMEQKDLAEKVTNILRPQPAPNAAAVSQEVEGLV